MIPCRCGAPSVVFIRDAYRCFPCAYDAANWPEPVTFTERFWDRVRALRERARAWRCEAVDWILDLVLRAALRLGRGRPDHLYHEDGSIYMERFWIVGDPADPKREERLFFLRLHGIRTHDMDPHMHDHPWPFWSLVLCGAYLEARPVKRTPCFAGERERAEYSIRGAGSLAFRRATDRHRIDTVAGDRGCWTLVLGGRITHWWGFYTPVGKIYWKDYPSYKKTADELQAARVAEPELEDIPFGEDDVARAIARDFDPELRMAVATNPELAPRAIGLDGPGERA